MRFKFKQAVHLGGQRFAYDSVHELSDEITALPYFHILLSHGLVIEADSVAPVTHHSLQDRNKDLAEKILAKKPEALKHEESAQSETESGNDEPSAEALGAEAGDEVESEESELKDDKGAAKKKKHKNKR